MNQDKWNQLKEKLLNAKETAKMDKYLNQVRSLEWELGEMNQLEKKSSSLMSDCFFI